MNSLNSYYGCVIQQLNGITYDIWRQAIVEDLPEPMQCSLVDLVFYPDEE